MSRTLPAAALAAILLTGPATADEITDALRDAIAAYEAGELGTALEDVARATGLLVSLRSQGLADFLPPALDGWSREVSGDAAEGLGFMGGGLIVEAVYAGPEDAFSIVMVADNPVVGAMAAMFANPAMMSTMGRVEEIGGESFLDADGEVSALVGGRVLVQASGAALPAMRAHLERIDFGALADFGR
ncbi:hypothetical protein P6F26_13720 [Roseibacterium sp. SDUM158017]|uniref:hypothetical protein n=1 Tax=Roseicyclus salinarum TaxID=3036773 RepID=UPI002414F9D4|nr:hypothetical protein [Roseibacterium sp. SDUM158017]MDG4649496.1 hypothetical protein [Roseibacterium sp. SDUM158017]